MLNEDSKVSLGAVKGQESWQDRICAVLGKLGKP